jgi:CHAT domain-containing protein/Tfp pilus assembly protein PilF
LGRFAILCVLSAGSIISALAQSVPNISQADRQEIQGGAQVAADSLYGSAKTAMQRDDLDSAEKYLQQSLATANKLEPGSLAVGRALNGLGDVTQERGMPPEAEDYYQKALAIIQKLDPSGADAANSLDGLAWLTAYRGDFTKSDEYALQAFTIRQKLDPNSLDFALSLNHMAGVYGRRGQRDKAEESLKKALSIQERLAPESLAVAETLKNLGNFCFYGRRYEDADIYQRRALTIREKLAPDSLAVADSLRWLGMYARDDEKKRDDYYRAALRIREKLAPGSIRVAEILSILAAPLRDGGDLIAAEANDRQALAIWQKLTPDVRQSRILMVELGYVLLAQGNLIEAQAWAQKALAESRRVDAGGGTVVLALELVSDIAIYRGDLAVADDYYHQAFQISEKLYPGGTTSALMMRGLGNVAQSRGDLAKAEGYYRRALAIWEKAMPNGIAVAYDLSNLGNVVHARGDLAQAEQHYRRALALWEKTVPDSLYIVGTLGSLGELARDQGDLAKAEEYRRRAIAIAQKRVSGGLIMAVELKALGDILSAKGELSEALESHQQALAIVERLIPGTESHAASLAAIAGIMRRKGDSGAAAQYYQQALDALESQAARFGGRDELRAGFRARHASYYQDYIDLLVEQKRFEVALQVLERSRARTLLETLVHVDVRQGADPALLEKKRSLEATLKAKSEWRIRMLTEKHTDEQIKGIEQQISDVTSEYQNVEARLRSNSPSYAALTQPHTLASNEIQQELLDPGTLLLEYSLGEERSHLFVVSLHSLKVFDLPKRVVIERQAQHVYELLTERNRQKKGETSAAKRARMAKAETEYPSAATRLSKTVLGPIAGELSHKRLLIVGDGALYYVPFAALPLHVPEKPLLPLAAEHEIVTLPSASVLAVLRRERMSRKPGAKLIAVLADPVFDRGDIRVKATASGSQQDGPGSTRAVNEAQDQPSETEQSRSTANLTRSAAEMGWDQERNGALYLPRLQFTRQEASAITTAAPPGQSLKALDFKASRATAISPDLASFRIVHFATHALLNNEHPELSGLVLSLVDEQGKPQNGFLDLQDIYNMNLPADLVVLSACETGLGRRIEGEGIVGLTRGFMYAGASRVAASLWKIDDRATAEFIRRFYGALLGQKMSPAAALRVAQLAIQNDRRWSSPYYWAAFQIQGEWK